MDTPGTRCEVGSGDHPGAQGQQSLLSLCFLKCRFCVATGLTIFPITKGKILLSGIEYFVNVIMC